MRLWFRNILLHYFEYEWFAALPRGKEGCKCCSYPTKVAGYNLHYRTLNMKFCCNLFPAGSEADFLMNFLCQHNVQSDISCNSAIKAHRASIWTKSIHLQYRTLNMKCGWNLFTGPGQEDFEEFHMLPHVQSSLPCNSAINAHWGSIWTNLVHLQYRTLNMKFGWNLFTGSGEEDFWRVMYVCTCFKLSPV